MKRSHSPSSRSSSSSSSSCESPRWDSSGRTTATSSSKRPRLDVDRSFNSRSPRVAARHGRSSSRSESSSSGEWGRPYGVQRQSRHDERRETGDRRKQVAVRHRSKESSDSDHSDGGTVSHHHGGLCSVVRTSSRSFDLEKYPYSSDVETLTSMTVADAIKEVTERKYDELTRNRYDQPNTYSKDRMKKVLASVIMKRRMSHKNDRLCIVSLGAGSKSIGGAFLTKKGNRVHDCHAEVLARRGLIRFLYSQLEEIKNGNRERSIFEKQGEVYALQENVSFHLFISKPPCGDASVFGLHENHQNRKRRGIARVTPADGEGAIHISWPPENDKTFDDYTSNEMPARLHKMCCSAKLARWNITGVQGALLSLYIEPVYFKSITIGSQFNVGHLKRAVYTRVSKIRSLSPTYRVNEPRLYQVSKPDNTTEKSHKMSLNWYLQQTLDDKQQLGEQQLQMVSPSGEEELIECQSGLTPNLSQEVSRLSKMEFFKCFVSLWDSLAPRALKQKLPGVSRNLQPYSAVKSLAVAYQEEKAKVAECFSEMPYGSRWLKMPPEVDQFCLADSSSESDTGDSD